MDTILAQTHAECQTTSKDRLLWTTDELAFRMIIRVDGQPLTSKPVKLYNGTTTVAPVVTIASRA